MDWNCLIEIVCCEWMKKRLCVQQWISSVYSPYNEANEAKLLKDKLLAEVTQKINNVHQMNKIVK